MKTTLAFAFLAYLLLASFALLQAQTQPQPKTASFTFDLVLERDTISPDIDILQKDEKTQLKLKFYDKSGIEKVWLNEREIPVNNDTSFSHDDEVKAEVLYTVKAIDVKGNINTDIYLIDQYGNLLRGVEIVGPPKDTTDFVTIKNAKYYALLIGVENYEDESIPDLDNPIDDVEALNSILTAKYSFDPQNVMILKDPTKREIERTLDELKNSIGMNDNLLIFFAGHGYWEKSLGYWLPSDAEINYTDTWVRNSTIRDYFKVIESQHTLLITDACFAGSILITRGIKDNPRGTKDNEVGAYDDLYQHKSRKGMTSGNLQLVPDQSVFIKYLLKCLEENTDSLLPALNLFSRLRDLVIEDKKSKIGSNEPTPLYGEIRDLGNEGGEFIFIRKDTELSN